MRFKTKVSSCSRFPSEAMLWIKEVEMVKTVDDLKSSRPIQGFSHFPNFEMLDARIASASWTRSSRTPTSSTSWVCRNRKLKKEDRFHRGRQIAYMIYDYFRVTGAHESVLGYLDLFSITHRNDNVHEFDTRWDEVLLSMTKLPPGTWYKMGESSIICQRLLMISWKVCTNWGHVRLIKSKLY